MSTNQKINTEFSGRIISCSEGNLIYFTDRGVVKDKERLIYTYNIKSGDINVSRIEKTKQTKLISKDLRSIIVQGDKAIILSSNFIYTLVIKGETWELLKVQKNKLNFSGLYKLNADFCLLYVNYNFHPMDAPDKHLWAKYNLKSDGVESVTKMDDANVLFSHYVNSWISTYKGVVAYANTTDYKIRFYNDTFHCFDSITSEVLNENKAHIKNVKLNGRDEIVAFKKYDDSLLTRIQKVILLDSSTALIYKKLPEDNVFEADLWRKTSNNWHLAGTQKNSGFYVNGESYTKNKQPFYHLTGNSTGIEVHNRDLYFISYPYMPMLIMDAFDRKRDYDRPQNEAYLKDELYYEIAKYKVSGR